MVRDKNSLHETNFNIRSFSGVSSTLCCISAGHVAIEVGELSDGQEKEDENKKSGGPG